MPRPVITSPHRNKVSSRSPTSPTLPGHLLSARIPDTGQAHRLARVKRLHGGPPHPAPWPTASGPINDPPPGRRPAPGPGELRTRRSRRDPRNARDSRRGAVALSDGAGSPAGQLPPHVGPAPQPPDATRAIVAASRPGSRPRYGASRTVTGLQRRRNAQSRRYL